jgi:hypothetical protein
VNPSLQPALRGAEASTGGDLWLVRLRPHESLERVSGLLRGEEMLAWYQDKLTLLREHVDAAMVGGAEVGRTLNDGGDINRNLEEVVGPEAFRALVNRMFRSGP